MASDSNTELRSIDISLPADFLNLQSTLTMSRRQRPPPMDISTEQEQKNRIPLKESQREPQPMAREPKVERRQSRSALRSLFTKNKVERPTISMPILEENIPASAIPERSRRVVAESGLKRSLSLRRNRTEAEKSPATPVTPVRPGSRMKMPTKAPAKPSPKSPKSPKSTSRAPRRTSTAWDPPPLFQAYPQAIKHAQLSASTLSADTILRLNNHTKNNGLRDEIAQARMGHAAETTAAARNAAKSKSKHHRQLSGSLSKADWTQKIFVLVTSGYLLQYAGDGSFDRLPEKMMQLGKDSVAFASDVIPGKHWVLQISQAMDSDGTPAADSRSFLSRLGFRGADYRRTATSLLLVFNSPEDMDSWLAVVRREIEALGGKKHVSETGKPKPDDKVMKLEAQPSHRYQITRDPDQASIPPSPQLPHFGPPPWRTERDDELHQKLEEAVNSWTSPQLPLFSPSAGERSGTNSVISHAERQLDGLRDSSNRFSYMSSGERTLITTTEGTPATSPVRATTPGFDNVSLKFEAPPPTEEARPRPNASAINERRRSMQTIHTPSIEVPPQPKHFRHSTCVGPPRNGRNYPAGTPNFSVPNSSSKRWSAQKVPTALVSAPAPVRARESVLKGLRKTATPDLKDSRPLSPVKDLSPTSAESNHAFQEDKPVEPEAPLVETTPSQPEAESSPENEMSSLSQAKQLSEVTETSLPVTSPEAAPAPAPADSPRANRRSSLIPLQLPRKLQVLRESKSNIDMREISQREQLLNDLPPLPCSPDPLRRKVNSSRGNTLSPVPAIANTKSKMMRRPISLQVSSTPFSRSPKSPTTTKPSTPPGSLSLFPPRQQAPNTSRSVSPAFNEDVGILTPVTILSPSTSVQKTTPNSSSNNNSSRTTVNSLTPPSQSQKPKPVSTLSQDSDLSIFAPHPPKPKLFPSASHNSADVIHTPVTILSPTTSHSHPPSAHANHKSSKSRESSKSLNNRRSMPHMLVNGPPPAPPPDCALPPLPPGTCGKGTPVVFKTLRA